MEGEREERLAARMSESRRRKAFLSAVIVGSWDLSMDFGSKLETGVVERAWWM